MKQQKNLDYYKSKYKDIVVKNLDSEKAGISVSYKEWADQSQLVIPLADINGGLSTVDTSVISDKNVVNSMQEEDDKGIDERKNMVDIKEREADEAEEKARDSQKEARKEEEELKQEKKELEEKNEASKGILTTMKDALAGKVVDVKLSSHLKSHPVCLVSSEGISFEMEKVFAAMPGQDGSMKAGRILEINPNHEIFNKLQSIQANDELVKEYASLLYNQALLIEGFNVEDPVEFSNLICKLMINQ